MEKKPSEVLECAAELLSDPTPWTRGTYSRQEYKKASEILECAAKLLETAGWTQGEYFDEGKYCVVGALRQCEFGTPFYAHQSWTMNTARRYLAATLPASAGNDITAYNDKRGQKKTTIINKLRKAAANARKAGD